MENRPLTPKKRMIARTELKSKEIIGEPVGIIEKLRMCLYVLRNRAVVVIKFKTENLKEKYLNSCRKLDEKTKI